MAKEEHIAILRQGVEVWNRWRSDNPEAKPYFVHADLSKANLVGAKLEDAFLHESNLSEANLSN